MDVVVFGAGSLGSLVGGLLAREHRVTLVGREAHVRAIRESGLRLTGAYDETVFPDATTDGTGLRADLAVVTVKAFDTADAARQLATGEVDLALSLQNGLGNEETLARRLDCPVLAGTATYGAVRRDPGVVACTGRGEVVLGARAGGQSPEAERVGAAFRAAGLSTTVAPDMPHRLWEKLAVNAGINAVTALARLANGDLLDGPARGVALDAARETARVARAAGVPLSDADASEALLHVAETTAANHSSTYQDVRAGARTEVEALNGYVVDAGADHDVETPVNRTLASLLRAWEGARRS